ARAQALSKQLQDTHEQVEQTLVELNTFKELQALERVAIRSRVESLKDEVYKKTERENTLQSQYISLVQERNELLREESKNSETV
uniref:Uncharacterized protein n=1 Tax=Amphimedon queenslandica TaxID=400682 RepID=A0A1X7SPZ9_AMPQE